MNEANDLPSDHVALAGQIGVFRRREGGLLQRDRERTETRNECQPRIGSVRQLKEQADFFRRKGFIKWLGNKVRHTGTSCNESAPLAEAQSRVHLWERGGVDGPLRSRLNEDSSQGLDAELGAEVGVRDAGTKLLDQGCEKYDRRELREALPPLPGLQARPAPSRLVTMKGGLKGPALVIVPGIGGRADAFRLLAGLLETPKTIYVVRPRAFNGSAATDPSVEDIARRYLEEVRLAQPTGPYFLCGHSFGGLVAFEMARMLVAAGQEVAALILVAPIVHKKYWPLPYFAGVMVGRALFHLSMLRHLPVRRMPRQMEDVLRGLWRNWVRLRCAHRQNFGSLDSATIGPAEREIVSGFAAWTRYRPRLYPGKVTYFYGTADGRIPIDPRHIWRRWAREVELHNVPGGHSNILNPPYVGTLARDLDCYLAQVAEAAERVR